MARCPFLSILLVWPWQSDGSNPMISHVAEQTVHRIKQGMTRTDIGSYPIQSNPLF